MIEVIPAIDVIDGKCVRLEQGDFSRRTVYDADPIDAAKRFRDAGLTRLHIVDLDGARAGRPQNLAVLETISSLDDLLIDFGGGVRTTGDVKALLDAGASAVNIGSLTVKEPALFANMVRRFGPDKFLPGADICGGKAAVDAWKTVTSTNVIDLLARLRGLGIKEAFVTDVGSDGMMKGPAIGLYKELMASLPDMGLIASGGVRSIDDIRELDAAGCVGVIVGKALYERTIKLEEVAAYAGKADRGVS